MSNSDTLVQEVTRLHAQICSALSDPRRIMMLYLLAQRPWSVTDLAHEIGISQPAASRHLKVLRERGLVTATRRGASVEYALADRRLIQALDTLRQVLYDSVSTRASLLEQAQAQTAAQPAAESKPSSRENAL